MNILTQIFQVSLVKGHSIKPIPHPHPNSTQKYINWTCPAILVGLEEFLNQAEVLLRKSPNFFQYGNTLSKYQMRCLDFLNNRTENEQTTVSNQSHA